MLLFFLPYYNYKIKKPLKSGSILYKKVERCFYACKSIIFFSFYEYFLNIFLIFHKKSDLKSLLFPIYFPSEFCTGGAYTATNKKRY